MSSSADGNQVPPHETIKPFALSRVRGQPVSDAELLADLRKVAAVLDTTTVSMPQYDTNGQYDSSTVARRFQSWNRALLEAGLKISNEVNLSDERLFENILTLWQHYGRQPRRSELAEAPSVVSQSPYKRRFGSWTAALEAFIDYTEDTTADAPNGQTNTTVRRRTAQNVSLRLRFLVLKRDRFTCRGCGRSPAFNAEVELHVDHVTPWSRGGETVMENLQSLCSQCNIGKSNIEM